MNSIVYQHATTVKDEHMDMFGHVNNAAYLTLFEEARWALLTENGYGANKIKETGLGPVVLEIDIKFLKELYLKDEITIKSHIKSYVGKVGVIHQEIYRKDELCCQADIKVGLIDLQKRKLVEPSAEWIQAIGFRDGS